MVCQDPGTAPCQDPSTMACQDPATAPCRSQRSTGERPKLAGGSGQAQQRRARCRYRAARRAPGAGGRSPAAAPRTRGTEPRVAAPQPPPTPAREQLKLWHPNRGHQPRAATAPGAASSSQQLHTCYSATAEIPSLPRAQSTPCARSLVPSPYKRPSDEPRAARRPVPAQKGVRVGWGAVLEIDCSACSAAQRGASYRTCSKTAYGEFA